METVAWLMYKIWSKTIPTIARFTFEYGNSKKQSKNDLEVAKISSFSLEMFVMIGQPSQ